MTPAFASSHFILTLVMGAVATLGGLHLWLWLVGRMERSHFWVAAFCAASVIFQGGRYLEVQSGTGPDAIFAGRLQVAAVPIMIFTLIGFTRSLQDKSWSRHHYLSYFALTTLLSGIGLFTDFMISSHTFVTEDWFGHSHMTPDGAPGLLLIAVYALPVFGYLMREVHHSTRISLLEKRVVIGSAGAFLVLGLLTIASAVNWVSIPAVAYYGPLVIAGGMNFLLVHQHARMSVELESMVEERARRLQESNVRFRQLVNTAPVGILAMDARGRLVTVNPRLREILCLPAEAPGGDSSAGNLLKQPALAQSGMTLSLRRCLSTGRPEAAEFHPQLVDGSHAALRMNVTAIAGDDGDITGVQAIVEDISARRELEEKLRQSQKMEAIGRLAAGIAHEINNPMSYVRSNLTMLRDEWKQILDSVDLDNSPVHEQLRECEELIEDSLEGVERTVTIVREVNDFSHGQGDNKVEMDVNELLEESLRVASQQIGDEVQIELALSTIPHVMGSPGQIRQVFLNLIVNAIHAVGSGGSVRIESELAERDREVIARVIDDGCGITQDGIDRIFDPFFTTKAAGEGTGLGLYICYEIVRMHEGSIRVHSDEGHGTQFEVRLPLESATG